MKKLARGIDALIILTPSNLFYYTGYSNDDAVILITAEKKYYVSDKRIVEEAKELLFDFEVVDTGALSDLETAKNIAKDLGVVSLGYEENNILHKDYENLRKGDYKFKLKKAESVILKARSTKSKREIETIKKAQAVTDSVFSKLLLHIKPGMTELEVASFMNAEIYASGCTLAFDTIVAFGKNTSRPHAHPSDNVLKENDCVTVDFGAKYAGYCSDMTRSFVVGEPTDEYVELYNAVLEAQTRAIDELHAGIIGKDGDAIARNVLNERGYGKYFTHSLGHSLGVDIHEAPNLSPRSEAKIPVGAVTSVEPGAYIEGKFGVRIEDIVVFRKNRVDNLTKSPKHLIIVR